MTSDMRTNAAAICGGAVANQVSAIAMASSPALSAMLEAGSGEGVMAARAANFPLCAAKAIAAASSALKSCACGESCDVAAYPISAATGMRIKVGSAFHTKSKAGTLSAKNSTTNMAVAGPMTHQLVTSCNEA